MLAVNENELELKKEEKGSPFCYPMLLLLFVMGIL